MSSPYNFPKNKKIFIKNYFTSIQENKLFIFKVQNATSQSYYSNEEDSCEFESTVQKSGDQYLLSKDIVPPKDLIEIIEKELPDSDNMTIVIANEPMTEYIFIKDKGFYFGPFKWEVLNNEDGEVVIQLRWFDAKFMGMLKKDFIYEISSVDLSNHIISFKDENGFYCDVLNNFDNILSGLNEDNKCRKKDYISNRDLISYGLKELNKLTQANPTLKSFVNLIRQPAFENHFRNITKSNNDSRLHKFMNMANSLQSILPKLQGKVDNINNVIKELVASNPDVYGMSEVMLASKDSSNINEDLEREIIALQEKHQVYLAVDELKLEINRERDNLENLRKEYSELQIKYKDAQQKMDDSERLDAKIKEQERKIKDLRATHNVIEEYAALEDLKRSLDIEQLKTKYQATNAAYNDTLKLVEENIKSKEAYKKSLDDTIQNLSKTYESKVRHQLIEIKPYVDFLNGNYINGNEIESRDISLKYHKLENSGNKHQEVIRYISSYLNSHKRNLEDWQIANLLICMQQSFLTIFAGLPGTGKTSLARLLIKSQGLLDVRHKEVAVSRGWTSEKDLIGFYNPLVSQFQPASTGLYEFLLTLSNEYKNFENGNISEIGMSYIILDEANLSPMEHYWSKFMGMTDTFNANNVFNLGDISHIPHHLRFIATINYDATTEMLSPRIIDRSPIIVLDYHQRSVLNDLSQVIIDKEILPITFSEMEDLFGRSSQNDADFTTSRERDVFSELKAVLQDLDDELGLPIHISHRKEQSIKEYCAKASGIMSDKDYPLRALDLAILQFILPQVKGHGTSFINRVNKVKEISDSHLLSNTTKYLEKMLRHAKNDFDTIDFFCW